MCPSIDSIYGETVSSIKTQDVKEGQPLTCKIKNSEAKRIGDDTKIVLTMEDGRSWFVNKTNARRLSELFNNPNYDQWVGKSFNLIRSWTTYQGQEIACLRVQRKIE